MFAIYKKELRSYFNSFIGLLFIGVILFFLGLYYTVYNLFKGYPYYSYVISGTSFLFLITIPVLTMRILSEERHSKTDQLILTAPVSVGGIVAGKFLALATIFAIPTVISCIYPVLLRDFGIVQWGDSYMAILAFFLYGLASIAICVLISSVTESQVIAAVISFGVLFLGYMMNSICSLISSSGNLLTKILGYFDLYTPFAELLQGTLNVNAVVYFVSLIVLSLFLAVQSIQKRRYSVSVKHLSAGAYSTGMIAIVVAVVAVVNVIVGELPGSITAIDLTNQKLYSLTDTTKEFLKTIDEDVTIYVLVNEDDQDTLVGHTLARYADFSDHITVEYVDPTVNPRFHQQYTSNSVTMNSMIVVSDKRSKVVYSGDLYASEVDYNTYETIISGYDGEGQITSALAYVTSDDTPMIYITEGHGEYSLSTSFKDGLAKLNAAYESINLMNYDSVPEDASCLFINGPLKDFSEDDKDKVIAYLERGGNVVAVTAYAEESMTNFEAILAYMGLEVAEGMVVEQNKDYYYQSPFYLLPDVSYSDYTVDMYISYYAFVPFATGIRIVNEEAEDISYTTFMQTSDKAYSEVNLTNTSDIKYEEEEDIMGPFAIGVEAVKKVLAGGKASEKTSSTDTVDATMIVIGCENFFTDDANAMVSGGNQMIFNNIMGSFSEHEVSVAVPVKDYAVSSLIVPQSSAITIGVIVTVFLPVGCLVLGFVIWFRRRKR
ncbi:MAG: Gldg family protein [Lachnospiraceae bacterium]|nr:Gldg family protein [Lachnospiraceae bacterium]